MDTPHLSLSSLLLLSLCLSFTLSLPTDPKPAGQQPGPQPGYNQRKKIQRYSPETAGGPAVGTVPGAAPGAMGGPPKATADVKPSIIELRMPAVHPAKEDAYICTAMQVPEGNNYIVKFAPETRVDRAHHMLVYGCEQPYQTKGAWPDGGLCKPGTNSGKIMFAWARNAPPTTLPKDVGFEIGNEAQVKWLVLQIHYKNPIRPSEAGDTSGVLLTVTPQPQDYIAGIYILMATQATILPHTKKTHADISCEFQADANIYPFAFRPHAHDLGVVITGYVHNASGWTMLGKGNPQWPQAFYPMDGEMVIHPTDKVVARCTYDSTDRDYITHIGGAHTDEMCNFYIMYYTQRLSGAESYYACPGNNYKELFATIPAGSDTPLPPNPALDELAAGHAHKGMDWSRAGKHSLDASFRGYERPSYPSRYPQAAVGQSPYQQRFLDGLGDYQNPYAYDSDYADTIYDQVINQRSRNRHPEDEEEEEEEEYLRQNGGYYPRAQFEDDAPVRTRGGGGANPGARDWRVSPNLRQRQQIEQTDSNYGNAARGYETDDAENISPAKANQAIHTKSSMNGKSASKQNHPPGPDVAIPNSSLTVVSSFPVITAEDNIVWGQVAGVDTDSEGNVFVFHRGPVEWTADSFDGNNNYNFADNGPIVVNTIIVLNPDGKVIDQWGKNRFYMPHGLTIDHTDAVWVTDVALHQVMRFPKGSQSPDLVLGKKLLPGYDDESFCKPTDVAVLPTGDFFVADGYCNNRVVKYSKDGVKLKEWGKSTQSVLDSGFPPPSEFRIPHSLTLIPELSRLCVADRENGRIQCFDYEGKFITQIHPKEFQGHVYAITYSQLNGLLYAVNFPNDYNNEVTVQGLTLHPETGKVLETWKPPQGFHKPHDIALSHDGQCIYVAEIGPNKLWKFHVDVAHMPVGINTHKSVKKGSLGHPSSVDMSRGEALEDEIEKETDEASDFGASLVIGGLLIVPVLIIVSVTIFLRLRKNAREHGGYKLVTPEEQLLVNGGSVAAGAASDDEEHDLWVKGQGQGQGRGQYIDLH